MKNQKVADSYDVFYCNNENAFSGEPLKIVEELVTHISSGLVLDVGAGWGRHSLFLASRGFHVTANEISPLAASRLKARAESLGLQLVVDQSDVVESKFDYEFDAVVCTFTLHHVLYADGERLLAKLQDITAPGGFHAMMIFSQDSDFYRESPENFFVRDIAHLEEMYKNWDLLSKFEIRVKTVATDTNGNPFENSTACMLARKRSS